jgi:PTH1 family peptidyl-tRNA hydrolase
MCQHADSGPSRPEGSSMHAFIGLGNPGVRYAGTRHNAGFEVIDTWLRRLDLELAPVSQRFHGAVATIAGLPVALVKPMTFMNRSGYAVSEAVGHYELDVHRIVVVCDDVNLPFGTLRLRATGSHGGHRGLESIIDALGTVEFARQRIGVDVPREADTLIDYVLEEFNKEETSDLPFVLDRACNQLELFVSDGCSEAASRYNGPSFTD